MTSDPSIARREDALDSMADYAGLGEQRWYIERWPALRFQRRIS